MSQTTAQLLELRKESIKFDNLSEWIQVRGDLLQLYRDYQQAVRTGDIEKEDGISGRQMKEFICNTCDDLLPGIAVYNGESRNEHLSVENLLKHCDLMCSANIKSLKRKRDSGVTPVAAMYVSSPPYKRSRHNSYGKGKGYPGKGYGKGKGKGKGKRKEKGKDPKVKDPKVKEKGKEKVKEKEKEKEKEAMTAGMRAGSGTITITTLPTLKAGVVIDLTLVVVLGIVTTP